MSIKGGIDRSAAGAERPNEYAALADLIHGYFHQDYDLISENPDEVVAVFRDEASPKDTQEVIDNIVRFVNSYGATDAELDTRFGEIFRPDIRFDHWASRTTRETLERMLQVLSKDR